MTELRKNDTAIASNSAIDMAQLQESAKKTAKKIISKILFYVPAAIIFALIALYYIQLSHMA